MYCLHPALLRTWTTPKAPKERHSVTHLDTPLSEADFALYWAMVSDQIIQRDEEIEKKYEEFIASARQ